MHRDADDHETPGGPFAVVRATYAEIQAMLIWSIDRATGANQHDEILDAVHALDRGEHEVRVNHLRLIRDDL